MNLEDKVLQLINKQIDDDVEFRTVLPTSKAIAKIMASFANTNGGFLIVGVKSTGRNIIFIWEHEIKDDWFWVGDYLIGGDANA
jgi:predicted HTH transcriptional regulator